jgi:hypothetical protein
LIRGASEELLKTLGLTKEDGKRMDYKDIAYLKNGTDVD